MPYLRPLLEGMQSGIYMSDKLRRRGIATEDGGYVFSRSNKTGGESFFSSRFTQPSSRNGLFSSANLSQLQRLDKFGGTAGETVVEITSPRKLNHGTATILNAGKKKSHSDIVKTTTMTTRWDRNDAWQEPV